MAGKSKKKAAKNKAKSSEPKSAARRIDEKIASLDDWRGRRLAEIRELRDPDKLFNAGLGGNKWRAIDLREDDALDRAALAALLREAIAYNAEHSVPKSKGSRV